MQGVEGRGHMSTIFDYIKRRGDFTFEQLPLNLIDSLAFTELCYAPFDKVLNSEINCRGITISALYKKFISDKTIPEKFGAFIPAHEIIELLKLMASSERYQNIRVRGYINDVSIDEEKQFCAMCFDLSEETSYISFSGTDDTIIGWKENFNMALFTPIPSQKEAFYYLNKVANSCTSRLYIGGHSKGGNLAVYSAVKANKQIQNRIIQVHNFDGPGFEREFIQHIKNTSILPKIINILPENTAVGAIFEDIGERVIVKSSAKGFLQHDAFTWKILDNDFVHARGVSKSSKEFHDLLNILVSQISEEEKKDLVEAIYKLFSVNNSTTLTDITSNKLKFLLGILKTDSKTRKIFFKAIKIIIKEKYFKASVKKEAKRKCHKKSDLIEQNSEINIKKALK